MALQGLLAMLSVVVILPIVLLFWDYPGKRTHIAVRYLIAFAVVVVLLPVLIRTFGLWLPMAAPLLVFAYAYATRIRRRSDGPNARSK